MPSSSALLCEETTYSIPSYHDWKRVGCRLARVGARHVVLRDAESRMYWYICWIRDLCVGRTGTKCLDSKSRRRKHKARSCRSLNPDGVRAGDRSYQEQGRCWTGPAAGPSSHLWCYAEPVLPLKSTCLLWQGACFFSDTRNYLQLPISTQVTQAGHSNMHA
jgi:hypothetical protein